MRHLCSGKRVLEVFVGVFFAVVRPVTMEGQEFEIPEDPSQTLPERSPMDPIW